MRLLWLRTLISISLVTISKIHALVLFVIDEANQIFPVDPSPDATVRDLRREIASIQHVDAHHIVISFQDRTLTDLDALLAETGLSNQCMLSIKTIDTVIALPAFDRYTRKVSESDVLQWDTHKDLTQYAWLDRTLTVSINFHSRDGLINGRIYYKTSSIAAGFGMRSKQTTAPHLFFIVDDNGKEGDIHKLAPHRFVIPETLHTPDYAMDILVTPADGQTMALAYSFGSRDISYRFPTGYSLLLRHQNVTTTQ